MKRNALSSFSHAAFSVALDKSNHACRPVCTQASLHGRRCSRARCLLGVGAALRMPELNHLGQNIIRPDPAVLRDADVSQPYGGKPRVIMADLDSHALAARGLPPSDVSRALQRQKRDLARRRREDRPGTTSWA